MNQKKLDIDVHVEVRVSFPVFDVSGSLPFEIVYSLARPRTVFGHDTSNSFESNIIHEPLKIYISESILDIPFALKHGFLMIQDQSNNDMFLNFDDLKLGASTSSDYVTLEASEIVKIRSSHRMIELKEKIDSEDQIGRKLLANHRYRLVLPNDSHAFPVKKFLIGGVGTTLQHDHIGPSNVLSLRKVGHTGRVEFTVLPSLQKAPEVTVRLSASSSIMYKRELQIKAEIINHSQGDITIKSRGSQHFLSFLSRLGPERDDRPRIPYYAANQPEQTIPSIHWSNISITNISSGEEVVPTYQQICTTPVRASAKKSAKSPSLGFTTLRPNTPYIIQDTLDNILPRSTHFSPGRYQLKLVPLGATWYSGTFDEAFGQNHVTENRNLASLTLPVMLATNDVINFEVRNQ